MLSCNDCPERDSCKFICPKVEKLLPPENGGCDYDFDPEERDCCWKIQDRAADLPWPDGEVAYLHYHLGWTQAMIAVQVGYSQMSISRILRRIRERIIG